jgi:PAS domain S-box-containing protein
MVGKKTCAQVLRTPKCGTPECLLKQVMESKKPVSGRREVIQNRQNREIQVEISASMITDFAGRVIGGFEAILDVTPMVEAQRKIDQLIELTQAGILMVDENQRILFAISRVAEFLQTSRQELFGKSLGKVLTRQHVRIARELSQMLEQGQQKDLQFCGPLNKRHPQEGESRYFETTMAISRLGKSAITYISLWDLTEHIKLENELIKANNFLNNIIRCSVDGIVVLDTKGNPLLFNEGAEHILGYKAEEVIGHQEVLHKIYDRKFAADMMRRMRSDEYGPRDKLNSTRLTFVNKEGEEVPVNFSASIIRERGREVGSVGIFSDQRERVKMRKKLEESQAQLMQSEKIASLGRLAAGVAHEINNPLAGILIYAELLQLDLEEKAETSQKVAEIIDQTLRCKQIVTRLLEFSRQSLGDRTLFNLNEMISRCVDLISHQALIHNIEIVQHLDPELPQIVGDPGQLQQVVTNLLLNAADAIHGRGRITIASQAAPQGEGVILTFTDTGRGIPQEIRNKIFEPFFTTKPPGKGTGLGLSIVYGVIQRHGGSIQVDSSPGEGTTFTLKLPLDSPQEGSPIL